MKEKDLDDNSRLISYSIQVETHSEETEETTYTFESIVTEETEETVTFSDITEISETAVPDERVNINTADRSLLTTLPMIGEKRADAIIAYRKEHGDFTEIRDIMNVSGIGKKIYNRIKEKIKV